MSDVSETFCIISGWYHADPWWWRYISLMFDTYIISETSDNNPILTRLIAGQNFTEQSPREDVESYKREMIGWLVNIEPITVAAQSKTWTVFDRSNAGIVGSNTTQGMDVCVRLLCVCVVLCVGSGLATGWSPVQGILLTVYRLGDWKSGQGPQGL
jgi:hypothetical protein